MKDNYHQGDIFQIIDLQGEIYMLRARATLLEIKETMQ